MTIKRPLKAPPVPCGSCPYRKDVPSGIWAKIEYEKLVRYDGETWEQDPHIFMCHQRDGCLCGGWLACHDPRELLALRIGTIDPSVFSYTTDVAVFESGAAARAHGIRDIKRPEAKARKMVAGLMKAPFRKSTEDAIKGQHDMIAIDSNFGSINSKKTADGRYRCPHCPRLERTRVLMRAHIEAAHGSRKPALTTGDRVALTDRAKKVPVTLVTTPVATPHFKLTTAQVRALAAVGQGRVSNIFTATGNTFHGPKGIGSILYRKLQIARLIEDVPGGAINPIRSTRRQQLTAAGRALLATYGG
jgi:hypothetical protein